MSRKLLATVVAMVMALSACATVPSQGGIQLGEGAVASAEPLFPFAAGPRPGDGPTVTVRRFLEAAAAGVTQDFSVAREYLTELASATWDPNARVVVYDSGALTPDYDQESGLVRYQVPAVAILDESGRLDEQADSRVPLEFHVTEDEDGQWRISQLDDGILVPDAFLTSWFRPVELVFASEDGSTVVPEVRWLPDNNIATLAARELIEGPSPWLADAVTTGFPPGSALEVDSVVVADGVASVQLTGESAGSVAARSLAEQQIRLTLTALPDVTDVVVTVGGLPIGGDDSASLSRAPVPTANAAVLTEHRLGLWDGEDLFTVSEAIGRLPDDAASVAFSADGQRTAFVVGGSQLVTSNALSSNGAALVDYDPDALVPETVMSTDLVYEGEDLVAPVFDAHGWLWTAERTQPGTFIAIGPDGTVVEIAARALESDTVQAFSFSRDGARMAVLTRSGGRQLADVAGVVRSVDGTPLSVSESLSVGVDISPAVDVAWVDDVSIAVLGEQSEDAAPVVWVSQVGGLTEQYEAVDGATGLATRYGERSLVITAVDAGLRERADGGWSTLVSGVLDLSYQS